MAERNGRIDGWWKILHQDDSKMPCEELRFPNPWLCRVAQGSFPGKCALDIAFVRWYQNPDTSFFDFQGAKHVRVMNDYWFRTWKGVKLTYLLRSRDGRVVKNLSRTFGLPADTVVPVIAGSDTGDVWHVPGVFLQM